MQLDRRKSLVVDEDGVVAKFGVGPASIPDYLSLVGDAADGLPGVPGWGARSSATVLARWGRIEDIPADPARWEVAVRGAPKLAATLRDRYDDALLFKHLATLRVDRSLLGSVDELRWQGPTDGLRGRLRRARRARAGARGRGRGRRPFLRPHTRRFRLGGGLSGRGKATSAAYTTRSTTASGPGEDPAPDHGQPGRHRPRLAISQSGRAPTVPA